MYLSDIFSQLAAGELSQLHLVDQTTGEIATAKYGQLLSHVNLGLTALYKRFPLKEGRASVALKTNQVTYRLDTNEDVSFLSVPGEDDFEDDILKVERIYGDTGIELALNDASDPYSCYTTSATTLRVPVSIVNKVADLPDTLITNNLLVVYRANHPILVKGAGTFNPAEVQVQLPYSHLEPLLLFVASRVHNPIGMTNEFHSGNSYAAKYEKACQELETVNLRVDQGSQNNKAIQKGFP